MTSTAIALLLGLTVAASWFTCLGLWRLPTNTDRLHLIAFVTLAAGLPLLAAAILTEGTTARVAKILAIVAINLVSGAAGSHALGRALRHRGDA